MTVMSLVTGPSAEPITTAEAKTHLRIDGSDEDAYVDRLIKAARQKLDGPYGWLGRALVAQVWDQVLQRFPAGDRPIYLGLAPVQSVTSITYIDTAGASQTFDAAKYALSRDRDRRPRIDLAYGQSWPSTRDQPDAAIVRFAAGYTVSDSPLDRDSIPEPLRQAMLLLIGDMYGLREDMVVGTIVARTNAVDALIADYERHWTGSE